jgi:sugar phosphate isomerase/epimerase
VQASWAGHYIAPLSTHDFSSWRSSAGDWEIAGDVTLAPDIRMLQARPGQGVIVNGPNGKTSHLVTRQSFGDVRAHIEFCVPKGSNSGVYFMGRYEIQVLDSWEQGEAYAGNQCGGIYQRWDDNRDPKGFEGHAPLVNVALRPGQWQTFDIVFRAPRFNAQGEKTSPAAFIKVVHNGQVVHEYVELSGPTRSSLYDDEALTGPIMLQGDHGSVAYRNLWIQPVDLEYCELPNPFFVFKSGAERAGDGSPRAQADLLKASGYDGVEHMGCDNLPPMLAELDKQNLRLFTIYTPIQVDPAQPPYDLRLKDVLPLLGGRQVILWMHTPRAQGTSMAQDQADRRIVEICRELSDLVRPYGVRIALYPHTWFWVDKVGHAVDLVRQVDRNNVGVVFNLCHRLKVEGEGDLKASLTRALPHLFAVSLNGADQGDTQAMDWARLIQPLNQGTYDTYRMVKTLMDLGYSGPVGLQCYNIKARPEDHLPASTRAWHILAQRREADRLLGLSQ